MKTTIEHRRYYGAESYLMYEQGYQDRMNGLHPQSMDDDYFRGYCERIHCEIDRELQAAA